ncbi:hypothetical protein [Bacillus sp. X1(2014)]|uniref:hypothetical protein n=1 Tax=Bacillus sp. X1(2014) TaxID=1565991 RepID=UPI0016434040|nr:hypothetical protein [Bacillus sp. X1(2014)]
MKKFVVLLFSISLVALFTTAKDVKVSTTNSDVAISTEDNVLNHPIQPPIG